MHFWTMQTRGADEGGTCYHQCRSLRASLGEFQAPQIERADIPVEIVGRETLAWRGGKSSVAPFRRRSDCYSLYLA